MKMKLFCIPPAATSALIYSSWKKYLNSSIELFPVELAGRGVRFKDKFYNNYIEAKNDIFNYISSNIKEDSDYSIFGHCMGSLLAYEVCKKIEKLNLKEPNHIFFSGRQPPNMIMKGKLIKEMSDKEIINELLESKTISFKLSKDVKFLKYFLPIWKSDCNIVDNYDYSSPILKLKSNISILIGNDDPLVNSDDLSGWKSYTLQKCNFYKFSGGHYFINENCNHVVELLNSILYKNI